MKGKPKSHAAHAVWDDTDLADAQQLASMKESARLTELEYNPADEFDFTEFVVNLANNESAEPASEPRRRGGRRGRRAAASAAECRAVDQSRAHDA